MDLRVEDVEVVVPAKSPGDVGLNEEGGVSVGDRVGVRLGEDEGRSRGGAVGFRGGGGGFAVGLRSVRRVR
jgi:hypothetical protein